MTLIQVCHHCHKRQYPCAGRCVCLADDLAEDIIVKAARGECPLRRFAGVSSDDPPPAAVPAPILPIPRAEDWGPPLWQKIHTVDHSPIALNAIRLQIPCGPCRQFFDEWCKSNPWIDALSGGWFEWGWRLHEAVNAKLGRPGMSLDAARELYGIPA